MSIKAVAWLLVLTGLFVQVVAPAHNRFAFAWEFLFPGENSIVTDFHQEYDTGEELEQYKGDLDTARGIGTVYIYGVLLMLAFALAEVFLPRARWAFRTGWILGGLVVFLNGLAVAWVYGMSLQLVWISAATGFPMVLGVVMGFLYPRYDRPKGPQGLAAADEAS